MFSEGCTVFSQIRRKAGLKPTALQAKRALKLICVSEFVSDLKNTNYFTDSDSHLLSFSKENIPLMKPKVAAESVTPLSGTPNMP